MKVQWLGHAAFLITSEDGVRIITDPYAPDERLTYGPIDAAADIVTVSHEHRDHNNVATVKGNPEVVRDPGRRQVKGVDILGVSTFHDARSGGQRGGNTIFRLTVDGVKVCHLGDLGHPLGESQAEELAPVDVLLVPVGGYYTIDAALATRVCDLLNPRVVIPMHFRNPECDFPIADVEPFLQGRPNVRRLDGSEVELKKETLPTATETVVLKPAR